MTFGHGARIAVLAPLVAACMYKSDPLSPFGRAASVHPRTGYDETGELLAATSDSLWLLTRNGVQAFASAELRSVVVVRHRFDATWTFKSSLLVGVGTGLALAVACATYEGGSGDSSGCLFIVPVMTLFSFTVGTVPALFNWYSSKHHLSARDIERLRSYSRFPQGIPDAFSRTQP